MQYTSRDRSLGALRGALMEIDNSGGSRIAMQHRGPMTGANTHLLSPREQQLRPHLPRPQMKDSPRSCTPALTATAFNLPIRCKSEIGQV